MKLADIAAQFQLESRGADDVLIDGIASLIEARPGQLAFLFNSNYKSQLTESAASAFVLRPADAEMTDKPVIIADNPRLTWAGIASLFDPEPAVHPGVHASAVIESGAVLGTDVNVGPNVVIEADAEVGDRAVIGAGSHIGAGAVIGAETRIDSNVVIYHQVTIGERCRIFSNAVIGADGFGYEFEAGEFIKIPQIYSVRIGNDVDIGAGTTIDRGALNDTQVGDGCKLDNQVQVGHGTRIGHHTVISGCTAIAGSTKIGSYCLIGGAAGIIDNIEIADQVEISAMTLVSHSIREKGRYSSGTGLWPGREWRRSVVGFGKLDEILKRLRRLEAKE